MLRLALLSAALAAGESLLLDFNASNGVLQIA
jgi:hypothetical protein